MQYSHALGHLAGRQFIKLLYMQLGCIGSLTPMARDGNKTRYIGYCGYNARRCIAVNVQLVTELKCISYTANSTPPRCPAWSKNCHPLTSPIRSRETTPTKALQGCVQRKVYMLVIACSS